MGIHERQYCPRKYRRPTRTSRVVATVPALITAVILVAGCQGSAGSDLSTASLDSLITQIKSGDEDATIQALVEVSARGPSAINAVPTIEALLPTFSYDETVMALNALRNIGTVSDRGIVYIEGLVMECSPAAPTAAQTLGSVGASESIVVLSQAAERCSDESIKETSMQAIVDLGGAAQSLDTFANVLNTMNSRSVQIVAIEAIGAAQEDAACYVPMLITKLNATEDVYIQQSAAIAIRDIMSLGYSDYHLSDDGTPQIVLDVRDWWLNTGSNTEWPVCD